MLDDNRRIGLGLAGLGLLLMCLGVLMFFDRKLLILGNLTFIGGLVFLLGPKKAGRFFWSKKGPSLFFFGGFAIIVFIGSPFVTFGFVVECFGVGKLFASFLPNVVQYLKFTPGVKQVLAQPPFVYLVDYIEGTRTLPV